MTCMPHSREHPCCGVPFLGKRLSVKIDNRYLPAVPTPFTSTHLPSSLTSDVLLLRCRAPRPALSFTFRMLVYSWIASFACYFMRRASMAVKVVTSILRGVEEASSTLPCHARPCHVHCPLTPIAGFQTLVWYGTIPISCQKSLHRIGKVPDTSFLD